MEWQIITARHALSLSNKILTLIEEGWEPIGNHQVVIIHSQNRYTGNMHIDTKHESEYSQTMRRFEHET